MPAQSEAGKPQYRIFETRQFLRDLSRLGPDAQKRLANKLHAYVYRALRESPQFGPNIKRLKNWDPPTWRYRVGDWRFFYEIDDGKRVAFMTVADHRRAAYR